MKQYQDLALIHDHLRGKDLSTLTDRELLTALLSYTEPEGAAEIALRLTEECGTPIGILQANEKTLLACGVSRHGAAMLQMLLPAYGRFRRSAFPADTKFDTVEKLGTYFSDCFCGIPIETVYLLLLREDYTAIDCHRMASGSVNSANLNIRSMVETALFGGAKYVAVAHNHPGGDTTPSYADMTATVNLKQAFETVGIHLLEHIVVAGEHFVPILLSSEQLCRQKNRPLK